MMGWFHGLAATWSGLHSATHLSVYELDRDNVTNPNGRIRPFVPSTGYSRDPICQKQTSPGEMRFSGWRLAHAVTKTDLMRGFLLSGLHRLGVFLEMCAMLDWREIPLRLFRDRGTALADFSGTSLSGRLGQGAALLLLEEKGYGFASRYPRPTKEKGADFLCQNAIGERALVEAKGSFVRFDHTPNIKGDLAEAITQLQAAGIHRDKDFAVATYIREVDDPHDEPSLVAFVDPDPTDQAPPPHNDDVRRENYAAWLDGMGFVEAASDLRLSRRGQVRPETRLLALTTRQRRFGVRVLGARTKSESLAVKPVDTLRFVVMGIALEHVRVIEEALDWGAELSRIQLTDVVGEATQGDDRHGFYGSVLGDGTLLGEVDASALPFDNTDTVRL